MIDTIPEHEVVSQATALHKEYSWDLSYAFPVQLSTTMHSLQLSWKKFWGLAQGPPAIVSPLHCRVCRGGCYATDPMISNQSHILLYSNLWDSAEVIDGHWTVSTLRNLHKLWHIICLWHTCQKSALIVCHRLYCADVWQLAARTRTRSIHVIYSWARLEYVILFCSWSFGCVVLARCYLPWNLQKIRCSFSLFCTKNAKIVQL